MPRIGLGSNQGAPVKNLLKFRPVSALLSPRRTIVRREANVLGKLKKMGAEAETSGGLRPADSEVGKGVMRARLRRSAQLRARSS